MGIVEGFTLFSSSGSVITLVKSTPPSPGSSKPVLKMYFLNNSSIDFCIYVNIPVCTVYTAGRGGGKNYKALFFIDFKKSYIFTLLHFLDTKNGDEALYIDIVCKGLSLGYK